MKTIAEFDTVIGTTNLGDEIIMSSLREQLDFLFRNSFVMRFGTHIKNFELKRYYFGSQKIEFAYKADFKIIMGTNLLSRNIKETQAQWPIGNMDSWLYKDCILAGVGTTLDEGKTTRYSKKIYNRILRKDFYHSVRDEASKRMLEEMGFLAINTGCPTLWKLTPEFCRQIPTGKSDRVVFSISGYKAQRNRKRDRLLMNILQENYDELIFWCQTSQDEAYLNSFEGTEDIPRIWSLEAFADLLDEGNIDYVGTRLHGGVFALQHKVRSIVIAIDHRARGFHDTNNLVICERNDIENSLEDMINSDFATEIVIPQEEIETWKAQFLKEYPDREIITHDSLIRVKIVKGLKKAKRKLKRAPGKVKKILKKIYKKCRKKAKRIYRKTRAKVKNLYFRKIYSRKMKTMPVDNEKIMFFTFQGDYSCNPKYISEEIIRQKLPWKQVWVTLKDDMGDSFPESVELVRYNSKEYYDAMATSKVWIDNAFNFVKGYVEKKDEQIYVQTMHGSLGIKRIGPDDVNDEKRNERGHLSASLTDLCLSNSTFENMVYETSFWNKEQVLLTGHARDDIFFRDEAFNDSIHRKVCEYFALDPDDSDIRLALYAPTFRREEEASEYEGLEILSLKNALEERFGGKWYILWRAHHSGSRNPIGLRRSYVRDAGNYPDIQELMIAIDFGITDYSSWIFDYVLTGKRGLLYTPDLDLYRSALGFYYPIQEAPYPIAENNSEVAEAVRNFDDETFHKAVDVFLKARGCMDDGQASKRIVDILKQKIEA